MNNEFTRLKTIFENAPLGVFLTTVSGRFEDLNNQLVKIFGYDSVDDIKSNVKDLAKDLYADPKDRDRMLIETKGKEEISVFEVKFRRKDGSLVETRMSIRPYKNPDNNIDYFIGIVEDVTEQKILQEKVRVNENKYRQLFEKSNDAIIFILGDKIVQFNNKARELFEIPINRKTISFKDLRIEDQSNDSDSLDLVTQYYQLALEGKLNKFEWLLKSFSGKRLHCEVSVSAIEIEEEKQLLAIIRDVTEKKEAEKKLKESEERYRSLVDSLPVGVLRSKINGEIIFVNNKLAEIGGFDRPDEFVSYYKNMIEIYKNKADRESIISKLAKGETVNTVLEVKTKESKSRFVNIISSPKLTEKKGVENVTTIAEDITEKLKLEKKLKERDEMLLSVVDSFPFELSVIDISGEVIVQNDFSKKLYGDHVGEHFEELLTTEEAKVRWEEDCKEVMKGKIMDYELPVEKKGRISYLRRIKTPLKSNGKISGIINMSIDVSDRMRLQKEIEQHRDNLEHIVKSRTKEVRNLNDKLRGTNDELSAANQYLISQKKELELLINELKQTQEQLIQSEKMASIGILTSGIAHEINNPINFISSGLTGLEIIITDILEALNEYSASHCNMNVDCEWKNKFDEVDNAHRIAESKVNLPKLIDTMRTGVQRTTEIVKGLRTFSRLDVEHMLPSNINELIDSSLVILKNKYKGKVEIVKNYSFFEQVNCFPGKLGQVFLNLLLNSIQAIEKKGVIEIITRKVEKINSVEVRIKDNGKGIPPEIRKKIFDPFFTTKAVGEGTGLGLSIAHSIISEHNGNIEVFSKQDRGTEFIITLPL